MVILYGPCLIILNGQKVITVKNSGRWYSQFLQNTLSVSKEVWDKEKYRLI